ncbi:MAG TPA: PIN domain-containing protein [Verrucomicrobiae bacterium]
MKPVFVDTFFLLAALNPDDAHHEAALAWSDAYEGPLLTTAWVITEVADALAGLRHRRVFQEFQETLASEERLHIVSPDQNLWERGLRLYFSRPDKEWSLTDCISFTVMGDEGLTEALTGDHHFEQAGFVALLK